jgi:hypothetical protein
MKALVVSNCATSAYVGGLKNLFPDWEVRGVLQSLAEEWATQTCPNLSFVEYARNCDLHIGLPSAGTRYSQLLPERTQFVPIPHFSFRGLQPDCFHLTGFSSVLRAGNLYSRIVVASFKAGLTPALTGRLFNAKTYEAFDLINCYEVEKQNLIAHFGQYRIDLSDSLERWIARGNFLHSYNHPRVVAHFRIHTLDTCQPRFAVWQCLHTFRIGCVPMLIGKRDDRFDGGRGARRGDISSRAVPLVDTRQVSNPSAGPPREIRPSVISLASARAFGPWRAT